jgi:pimeloyl-ACP methyl ester carboxylesterase
VIAVKPGPLKRIGLKIIWFLGFLAALISLIPLILLPLITTVPYWLIIPLFIFYGGLVFLLLPRAKSLAAKATVLGGIVFTSILAVVFSQLFASTPPITGPDGQALPGSIATLEQVTINNSKQWITIRGKDQAKPVLLFLAGGPGGTQLAATRKVLGKLEDHFVVVNWDQPGAGKSYRSVNINELTPERYLADAQELTRYLLQRFDREKIYLVGESWGSILGIWMVQEHPGLYHSFVGIAQMVAFLETDLYDYELALNLTAAEGNIGTHRALQSQGPPPYYGKGTAWKVTRYIMVLSQHMMQNPRITGPGYDTFGDIFAAEYGLYDKVNYFRGLLRVMDIMWPQLWDVDLRRDAEELEVPIYLVEGRHDVNAPPHLAEDYFELLNAPYKELIWFEHSGHSPWVDESDKLVEVLTTIVQKHGLTAVYDK